MLAVRSLLLAASCACTVIAIMTSHPVTSVFTGGVSLIILLGIYRAARHVDTAFAQAIDCLIGGGTTRPRLLMHPTLAEAVRRVGRVLEGERLEAASRLELLQALCDSIPVPLFTVDSRNRWSIANRAGWKLTGADGPEGLQKELGSQALQLLQSLEVGRSVIVHAQDDGSRMLAHAGHWVSAEGTKRLVTLVPIDQMLDRVETQAWQDVVRVMAHEMINSLTPITAIAAGLPEMVLELQKAVGTNDTLTDVADSLETIRRRSAGLMNFVEKCRAVGATPFATIQDVAISDVIAPIARLMARPGRDPLLAVEYSDQAPGTTVRADIHLLEQALINLLQNAEDAVKDVVGPQIRVQVTTKDDSLRVSVIDNGTGLPPELRNKVFVPFFTTKPDGSGIGLTLARQIALAHGGSIEMEPVEPRGTAVTLSLPLFPYSREPSQVPE